MNGIPFPNFNPIAFEYGPIVIRWYALAYIAGIFGGFWYAKWLVSKESLWGALRRPTASDLDDLMLWVTLGIIAGGRLAYVIFYQPGFFLENPLQIFVIWSGGMAFHGGFMGVILVMYLFARSRGLSFLSMLDLAATVTPIGLLLGRIANFINGELWGRTTDVPWAIIFPEGGPVGRHPSQLYEAATEGLLLLIVLGLLVQRYGYRRPGLICGTFVAGYALARIFCEFFREPDPQLGFLLGNWATMGMLLSLPMLIIGTAFAVRATLRPERAA